MVTSARQRFSFDDYLVLEEGSTVKHEFLDGQVWAMAGGTPEHATLVNPQMLVEVLSPSTEDYYRGEKLAHYKQIRSLQEIVLVAHEERRIELWRREGDHWILEVFRGGGTASLASLGCELPLDEVYRNPLAD